MQEIEKQVLKISKYLYDRLVEVGKPMYTVQRPDSPIVSYYQRDAVKMGAMLKLKKIKVTGREAHGGHIRVSVHFYNTEKDVDLFIEEVG
jgi:selenocysteine lyase/cysteine desulfurase